MPPVSRSDGRWCPGPALIVIPRPYHHNADKDEDIGSHNDDMDADDDAVDMDADDDADDARGER